MAENLNYDNGCSSVTWVNGSDEGWCGYYNNDESTYSDYGMLYQWSAAMNGTTTEGAQGICPDGWHVPTDAEWTVLVNYLGGESIAGDKLKASPIDTPVSWDGSNTSGFTALPAGYRHPNSSFLRLGSYSFFWSSSIYNSNAWRYRLDFSSPSVSRLYNSLDIGFSVYCLKDD
jgi:uncharacterized protein (TIGR02145 family)